MSLRELGDAVQHTHGAESIRTRTSQRTPRRSAILFPIIMKVNRRSTIADCFAGPQRDFDLVRHWGQGRALVGVTVVPRRSRRSANCRRFGDLLAHGLCERNSAG